MRLERIFIAARKALNLYIWSLEQVLPVFNMDKYKIEECSKAARIILNSRSLYLFKCSLLDRIVHNSGRNYYSRPEPCFCPIH